MAPPSLRAKRSNPASFAAARKLDCFVAALLAMTAVMIAFAPPASAQAKDPVDLRILAINDFHGYLKPFAGGIRIDDPADKTKKITVPAGGAEHMATLVQELRGAYKNAIFVAAGD